MNTNPTDIPTPRTDVKVRALYDGTANREISEKHGGKLRWVSPDFARTLEHSLNEFCALFGFPITVGDNACTAQEKLAAALNKALIWHAQLDVLGCPPGNFALCEDPAAGRLCDRAVQLAINQATEKLTKENEELKSKFEIARRAWACAEAENKTLTASIKELEAEVAWLKRTLEK